MIKKIKYMWCLLIIMLFFSGCSVEEDPNEEVFSIYYINKEETKLEDSKYNFSAETTDGKIKEILEQIQTDTKNVQYSKLIPDELEIKEFYLDNRQLYLNFTEQYHRLSPVREVLMRAGIVRLFCQFPEVEYVGFQIEGAPLMESEDSPVGLMNEETFIDYTGDEINSYKYTVLTLYFANQSGDKLVKQNLNVHYSTNKSLEKVVVEQLINGPRSESMYPTVPDQTKVLGVTVKDDVCYVNLDEEFVRTLLEVKEEITIYSIVNSIVDTCNVEQVQILVDGKVNLTYRENMLLDTLYERNPNIIENDGEQDEENPEVEDYTGDTLEAQVGMDALEPAKEDTETGD